jgi:hypothetical protein
MIATVVRLANIFHAHGPGNVQVVRGNAVR